MRAVAPGRKALGSSRVTARRHLFKYFRPSADTTLRHRRSVCLTAPVTLFFFLINPRGMGMGGAGLRKSVLEVLEGIFTVK